MALLNLRVGFHSPAVQRRPTVGRSSGVPTRARDVEAPVRANEVGRIKTSFFRRFEDYDPTALEGNSNKKLFQSEAFVHHCTISCNSVTALLRQLEEERLVGVNPTRNISPLTVSDIT